MSTREPLRTVLVAQAQLSRFAGSEMVTLELIEQFVAWGARVVVATHASTPPLRPLIDATGGVEVIPVDALMDPARLDGYHIDLAWIHHGVLPPAILRAADSIPVVFNHMSGVHPIEFPIVPEAEADLATLSLFNSRETLERQRESGLLDRLDPERIGLFENPAPDAFLDVPARPVGDALIRIAVVSNHLPDEVREALESLEGVVEAVYIGESTPGGSPRRLDPAVLEPFDAVITIGKTVQYAICASRPVYCYDWFGGPGWLSAENFDAARARNFSGRGFTAREPSRIASELVDGFVDAHAFALVAADVHAPEFTLSTRLKEVLGRCAAAPEQQRSVTAETAASIAKLQEFTATWVRAGSRASRAADEAATVERARQALDEQVHALQDDLEAAQAIAARREQQVGELEALITTLRSDLADLAERERRLSARVAQSEEELATLRHFRARRSVRALVAVTRPFVLAGRAVRRVVPSRATQADR
ncbi:hypothetical protein FLP10_03150 [Agromyces intestinalis]|uniref:Glycosyltransferase n=1 Tax=Agromyces intestinalis TaxID=2592652 RepID=A0A5C1YFI4_9MICO|nr:hypothetical protein [Agromyces intestinalis]QEO13522.1 hypothetical protein FLP10_03150 [Agromyces intestinalis]